MNAITRLFAAETRDENILVNCASPGTVDTRMSGPNPEHSPEEAAKQLVWLSTLPDDGPSGGFFYGRQSLPW
jgi:NAD(P)-dependent dehydrogenase (short-subunit alcohol dehydrogenase family)